MSSLEELSVEFPISLKHIQPLIENVSRRYPLLPKYKIVMIVKIFFEVLRYFLIIGDTITLRHLFSVMKISTYTRINNNKYQRQIKINLTTSKDLNK